MDAVRFDTISKLFASRKSRRAAVGGGLGLAAATIGGRVLAQDATPVATPAVDPANPHPSADTATAKTEFLFVQPFDGGTWAPKAGEDGVYILTLAGTAANTVYFSDRPERIFGVTPNQQFLDGLGFTPDNPPNAAVVAQRAGDEDQEVLVIELLNPQYDAGTQTLTYDATVLADYGEHGLAHAARQQQDYQLGEAFGAGSLFIDDCADGVIVCKNDHDQTEYGRITGAYCYQPANSTCVPCEPQAQEACKHAFPDDCIQIHYEDGHPVTAVLCDGYPG